MSYSIVFTRSFKRSVKRLQKRFRHVKDDVRIAIQVLLQNPKLGVVIPGGSGIRKLRNSDHLDFRVLAPQRIENDR